MGEAWGARSLACAQILAIPVHTLHCHVPGMADESIVVRHQCGTKECPLQGWGEGGRGGVGSHLDQGFLSTVIERRWLQQGNATHPINKYIPCIQFPCITVDSR